MPSTPELPEGMPPVIFPGSPIPAGLGRNDTPAEELAVQGQLQAELHKRDTEPLPDKRAAIEASPLTAAILASGPKQPENNKDVINQMIDNAERDDKLTPAELQRLRQMLYEFEQRQKNRFDLPELEITDADRDMFMES